LSFGGAKDLKEHKNLSLETRVKGRRKENVTTPVTGGTPEDGPKPSSSNPKTRQNKKKRGHGTRMF